MWVLCGFEKALLGPGYDSPWCHLLTTEDSQVLEYAQDLKVLSLVTNTLHIRSIGKHIFYIKPMPVKMGIILYSNYIIFNILYSV